MKKIKVLQVFHQMNRGGAETLLMSLYRRFNKEKFHFDFVVHTREQGLFDEEIKKIGGNIYYAPTYKVFNHFEYIIWWKRFLKDNKYDIIHGHATGPAAVYLPVAKKNKLITIAHSHIYGSTNDIKQKIINLYQKPLNKIADYKLACSNEAGKWTFGKNGTYEVFNNAIDTEQFRFNIKIRKKIRSELGFDDDEKVLINVARFNTQKNHLFLIDIFYELVKILPNVHLILVGDGVLKAEIKNKVIELGLENKIHFMGVKENVQDYLCAADVFVFPSLYEGLGIVLIEAQCNGLYCYTSKDVVPKEVAITDDVCFIPLSYTASKWAEIISSNKAIELNERDIMYQKVIEKEYEISKQTRHLENFYERIVKKR